MTGRHLERVLRECFRTVEIAGKTALYPIPQRIARCSSERRQNRRRCRNGGRCLRRVRNIADSNRTMAVLVPPAAAAGTGIVALDARHRSIPAGLREIFEAGVLTQEGQSDRADRPMALLADDDLGDALVL